MHSLLKIASLFSLIVLAIGCNREKVTSPTIDFDSQTWQLVGPTNDHGPLFVMNMDAREYRGSNGKRLVEFLPIDDTAVFKRFLSVQSQSAQGGWVSDGLQASWDTDGTYNEVPYNGGELHGTQKVWHANGQLKIERNYLLGKLNGTDKGWYEDGSQMYSVINANGDEISGQAWDENGKEIGN